MAVTRIGRVSFTCADADRLGAFYQQALGLELVGIEHRKGASFSQLIGISGIEARVLLLRLGEQAIELMAFTEPGRPYPAGSTSNDPRFQHIAIVVSDMKAAYARLLACDGWSPITKPEPQHLPASSGGVTAFKFRDPEGHPLELLSFPPEKLPARWQNAPHRQGPYLGIDHSAIVITSTARSLAFYDGILGFSLAGSSLNRGPEQERLDAITYVVVEVTALAPRSREPPHLELLCYRSTGSRHGRPPLVPASNDIAATRLVLELDDLRSVERRFADGSVELASSGLVKYQNGRLARHIRDPDGHALILSG